MFNIMQKLTKRKGELFVLFSVGYQLREDDLFLNAVLENRQSISELYFPWDDFPNGRNTLSDSAFYKYDAIDKLKTDFEQIKSAGIKFNLLLNGNCYGKEAQSRQFFLRIGDTVDYLVNKYELSAVTTTSPLIAKFLKQNFPEIDVRASVNIGIESVDGMDYIADRFDSFYLKREYNRDMKRLKAAREWCDKNGKRLYGLCNSGCLNHCSAHTFHDNLVAHENEIAAMDNAYDFEGQCFTYLKNDDKKKEFLRITNFIRPEDVKIYEGLFDGMKLATRVNRNPAKIINSYVKGSYSGAVTELLEPDHSKLFYPFVIENKKIPEDFAFVVSNCDKQCDKCGYCRQIFDKAKTSLDEIITSE